MRPARLLFLFIFKWICGSGSRVRGKQASAASAAIGRTQLVRAYRRALLSHIRVSRQSDTSVGQRKVDVLKWFNHGPSSFPDLDALAPHWPPRSAVGDDTAKFIQAKMTDTSRYLGTATPLVLRDSQLLPQAATGQPEADEARSPASSASSTSSCTASDESAHDAPTIVYGQRRGSALHLLATDGEPEVASGHTACGRRLCLPCFYTEAQDPCVTLDRKWSPRCAARVIQPYRALWALDP